jgi:hypothetical protein
LWRTRAQIVQELNQGWESDKIYIHIRLGEGIVSLF